MYEDSNFLWNKEQKSHVWKYKIQIQLLDIASKTTRDRLFPK